MIIINSSYFWPMVGLSILVALIWANSRLANETIAWMQKEDELLERKSYIKYYTLMAVRLLCVFVFFTSGKEIDNTIKCWRENGKIVF
jgi:hypothetical protein